MAPTFEEVSTLGFDPELMGILVYLFGFISAIFFLVAEKKNSYIRFHAWQVCCSHNDSQLVIGNVPSFNCPDADSFCHLQPAGYVDVVPQCGSLGVRYVPGWLGVAILDECHHGLIHLCITCDIYILIIISYLLNQIKIIDRHR